MNKMFGITGIKVKAIEVNKNDVAEVNEFLAEHDGNIFDVQVIPMFQGYSRFVITYREEAEKKYYYWIDFNNPFGKVVLYRMEYDAYGRKDKETEEPVYSKEMEDIDGFVEAENKGDINIAYEILDADIKRQLGFLPEYEVG